MNRYLLAAVGVLLTAVLSLGWMMSGQAEEIGQLQQQSKQLAGDLESSEAEVLKQLEIKQKDERLFAQLDAENKRLKDLSDKSQRLTRQDLKNEECANTPLPESVVNRLRDRIHRQARSSAGPPAG